MTLPRHLLPLQSPLLTGTSVQDSQVRCPKTYHRFLRTKLNLRIHRFPHSRLTGSSTQNSRSSLSYLLLHDKLLEESNMGKKTLVEFWVDGPVESWVVGPVESWVGGPMS